MKERKLRRIGRWGSALAKTRGAKKLFVGLHTELTGWLDGMADGLRTSETATKIEDALYVLEEQIGLLDQVAENTIVWPGYYGEKGEEKDAEG